MGLDEFETPPIRDRTAQSRSVVLIGGTSHVGKSTLARTLAQRFPCVVHSTDGLARHPGRPWPSPNGAPVRRHVAEHYARLGTEHLLQDVLTHYERNVLPQIRDLVRERTRSPTDPCAVIEGSALWPGFIEDLFQRPDIQCVWLDASDHLIEERIHGSSNYSDRDASQRYLIDKFLARTLAYAEAMRQALDSLAVSPVPVDDRTSTELANFVWPPGRP